jgi:type IV pilus modification protein PilV
VTGFSRRPRVRGEEGMTLVELLIAMMVLTVGILALVAAYSSGYVALNRATRISSATMVADAQMERFRALQYSAIKLNTSCGATCTEDSTFTGDTAYNSTAQVTGCASSTETTCLPTQTKTGPDGKSYRLDTYIEYSCVSGTFASATSCGAGNPYPVKRVTLVVSSSSLTSSVREQSDFTSFPGS